MANMKNFFADKRYPGRFIIVGKDRGAAVVIYGATGRSPSSLRREFVEQGDGVYMTAVDATVAIEGNPDLLEYPAVRIFENGIVSANGNQIERVDSLAFEGMNAKNYLANVLADETYEPDEHTTPRITGCVVLGPAEDAALHIVRTDNGGINRSAWSVPLQDGSGSYIATYAGPDAKPTPSFVGEPLQVPLAFGSAEAAVRSVFDMLAPAPGTPDYRIGVVAAYVDGEGTPDIAIVNKLARVSA